MMNQCDTKEELFLRVQHNIIVCYVGRQNVCCHAYYVHCLLFFFFHPHFFPLFQERNHFPWVCWCVLGNISVFISLQTFSISLFTIWQKNSFEILFLPCLWTTTSTTAYTFFGINLQWTKLQPKRTWTFFPFDLNSDWPIRRNRYAESKCGVMGRHTDGVFVIEVSKTRTQKREKCEEETAESVHI